MSRDKQIEKIVKDLHSAYAINKLYTEDVAEYLYNAGYRKASEVVIEAVDDFQSRIRNIFLNMCDYNDYNTLNLLQIDSAIECLFDAFVAELKKKYTEGGE